MNVLNVAVPTPLRRLFDYLPTQGLDLSQIKAGMRVRIPFQQRELVGLVMGVSDTTDVPKNKLKPIIELIDHEPAVPADILQLGIWAADYYHHPVGDVLLSMVPAWFRQGRALELTRAKKLIHTTTVELPLPLNAAQQTAVSAIVASQNNFQVFLLNGVTGSGKTEVYLQAIAEVLQQQQQVLVLVPEIGLTPQTVQRFRQRFSEPVVALHSAMTEKERFHAWLQAKSGDIKIIIGTRSAVFTPFANLGLIVIDEEHDLSLKQQDSFRYHARDVAIKRAHMNKIPIVLGSATPSLESLQNAELGRYQQLHLRERAGKALLPEFKILDARNLTLEHGLSTPLLNEMREHLQRGEQVMVFLNRRGYAPVLVCSACGWMAKCKRCDARMTYHYKAARLHCHHCDAQRNLAVRCDGCNATNLQAVGQGTERLESALTNYFSQYSIARIDRDSTRKKGAMEDVLEKIQRGEHQILIGTQMLAKGHHFPHVTLVAVIDADGGFFSADFRALERMGQLLLQVAGRAGRDEKRGKVLIQTHQPHHPLLLQLLQDNYERFAASLLKERAEAELPPFSYFALFRAEAHRMEDAREFLQEIKKQLPSGDQAVYAIGPIAAPMPRRAGRHRVQLLLQAKQRGNLQTLLDALMPRIEALPAKHRVRWSLDVDPLEMF